jgi:ABC-2 type transport system ATP-binding protein
MITTSGLTKRYSRTTALRDLTVTIPEGGITALMGPNGAGKSTLLKMCIGFERPTAGRLEVLGIDPTRQRDRAVGAIGYVPQSPSLYRDISVEDHLQLALALRPGFDVPHARQRLQVLEIPLRAKPRELSGGQQAQISLALALGTRATLLLLDEPLANLDPLARREFLRVVTEAVATGDVSALLSSHALSEIEFVADRLLVLGEGQVLFHDTVAASLSAHRVTDDSLDGGREALIGRFPGARNEMHSLVRSSDPSVGRAPSLEEVILGYLVAARAGSPAARAAGSEVPA